MLDDNGRAFRVVGDVSQILIALDVENESDGRSQIVESFFSGIPLSVRSGYFGTESDDELATSFNDRCELTSHDDTPLTLR